MQIDRRPCMSMTRLPREGVVGLLLLRQSSWTTGRAQGSRWPGEEDRLYGCTDSSREMEMETHVMPNDPRCWPGCCLRFSLTITASIFSTTSQELHKSIYQLNYGKTSNQQRNGWKRTWCRSKDAAVSVCVWRLIAASIFSTTSQGLHTYQLNFVKTSNRVCW